MSTPHEAAKKHRDNVKASKIRIRWCPYCDLWLVELFYERKSGKPAWKAIYGYSELYDAEVHCERFTKNTWDQQRGLRKLKTVVTRKPKAATAG